MCHPVVQQAGKRPFDKQFGWQAYKLSIEMTETSKDVKLSLLVPLAKKPTDVVLHKDADALSGLT